MYKLNDFVDRLNLKSTSLIFAFILAISGIVMIFMGITNQGVIDIKSAIISGKLETGSIGLCLVFLGVFVTITNLFTGNKPHKIKVKKNDVEINWEGQIRSSERMGNLINKMLSEIDRDAGNG